MNQQEAPTRLVYIDMLRSQSKVILWIGTVSTGFFASFLLVDGLQARAWWEIAIALWLFLAARELAIEAQINHLEYLLNKNGIVCFDGQKSIEIRWDSVIKVSRKQTLWLPIGWKVFRIYDIEGDKGQRIRISPHRLKTNQEEIRLLVERLEQLRDHKRLSSNCQT